MMEVCYTYKIRVLKPDKSTTDETMKVNEQNTRFGEAMAVGKVARYYETLREEKKILDYKILY